jgi:hypothetical protein
MPEERGPDEELVGTAAARQEARAGRLGPAASAGERGAARGRARRDAPKDACRAGPRPRCPSSWLLAVYPG